MVAVGLSVSGGFGVAQSGDMPNDPFRKTADALQFYLWLVLAQSEST